MAKAGGGGGAGAGGNGALTWVVSGGRRGAGAGVPGAALFPAGRGDVIPQGRPGVVGKGKEREIRRPERAPRRGSCRQNPPLPAPFLLSLPLRRLGPQE